MIVQTNLRHCELLNLGFSNSLDCLEPVGVPRIGINRLILESIFFSVLAFLRPQSLACHNSSDHHVANNEVHQKKQQDRCAPNNVYGFAGKCLANSKCSSYQSSVWEYKREPSHGKRHSARANGRAMCDAGDDKEENCQSVNKSVVMRPEQGDAISYPQSHKAAKSTTTCRTRRRVHLRP